jgi:hypothetical protein
MNSDGLLFRFIDIKSGIVEFKIRFQEIQIQKTDYQTRHQLLRSFLRVKDSHCKKG